MLGAREVVVVERLDELLRVEEVEEDVEDEEFFVTGA